MTPSTASAAGTPAGSGPRSVEDMEPSGPTPPKALRSRDSALHGLSLNQLRGATWERLSHGVHAKVSPGRTLLDRAAAMSAVLPPKSGYGHLTGAALREWWLPNRLGSHVMFATTAGSLHVQRRGLYVRRSTFASAGLVDGVPVMEPPVLLIELARDLSLVDLVPFVDQALAGGATEAEILAAAHPRVPGARRLRRALALADRKSESWWESVLRLMHVLAGLGPVESQIDLASDDGRFVARADLHLVGTRRYPECDGGEHRTRARHRTDLRRDRSMSAGGLERYGYTTEEIAGQAQVIIRDAEEARGLSPDLARVRAWRRHAVSSTLTAHGRARLAARLERYRLATHRPPKRKAPPRRTPSSGGNLSV